MLHVGNVYLHFPLNVECGHFEPNVGKYSLHGASGEDIPRHHFPWRGISGVIKPFIIGRGPPCSLYLCFLC